MNAVEWGCRRSRGSGSRARRVAESKALLRPRGRGRARPVRGALCALRSARQSGSSAFLTPAMPTRRSSRSTPHGTGRRSSTNAGGLSGRPRWSPASAPRSHSTRRGEDGNLGRSDAMDADGSHERNLTHSAGTDDEARSLSVDGTRSSTTSITSSTRFPSTAAPRRRSSVRASPAAMPINRRSRLTGRRSHSPTSRADIWVCSTSC